MRRLLALTILIMLVATAADAKTLRRGKTTPPKFAVSDDYNPQFPVGCGSNSNPNASGCATFGTLLYQFLAKEFQLEDTEKGFGNFVYIGTNANSCLGATGAGLVMTPTSCIAYNANIRGTDTGNITFADGSTTWVAMDACNQTPSGCRQNNPGLPNFTRVQGTHYLIDAIDVAAPTMATDSQLLMKVTTLGGSITAVVDLRNFSPTSGGGGSSQIVCAQKFPGTDIFAKINAAIRSPVCTLSTKVGGCSIIDRCDGTPYGTVTETITSGALVAAVPVNITFTQKYKYTGVAIANGFVQLNDGSSGSVLQCPISNAQPGTSAETPTPVCGFDYEPASSSGPVIQVPNNGAWLDHMSFLNLGIVGNENVTDAWQLNGNGVDTDVWSGNVAVCSAAPCSTHRPTGYVLNFTGSGEINTNWITSNVFQGWSKALFGGSQSVGLVVKNNQFADMVGDSTHPIIDLGHGCCFQYDFEDNTIQNMSAAVNTIVLQLGNTGRVANNHWENDNLSHLATGGGICDANLFFYRGAFTTNNMNGGASAANDAPAYALCGVTNFNDAAITNNNITNYAVAGENVSGFETYQDNAYYADKGSVSLLEHAGAPSLVSSGLNNPLGPVGIFGKNLVPDSEIKNGTAYWTLNGVMTEGLGTGPGAANIFTYTGTGAPQAAVFTQSAPFPVKAGDTVTCSGYEDLTNVPTGAHPIWGLYSPDLGTQYAITFVTLGTKGITPIMQYVVAGGVTALTMVATSNSATATTGQPVSFTKPMCQVGTLQTPYVPNIGSDLTPSLPILSHTLSGATPVALLNSVTSPAHDAQHLVMTQNVTTFTLPAASVTPLDEVLLVYIQQGALSAFTLPTATVGPFTAGAGTTVTAATGITCPTIGTTAGATGTASELHVNITYPAVGEWVVESCQDVR